MSINDVRTTHAQWLTCPAWCSKPADPDVHDPAGQDCDGTLFRRHAAILPDAAGYQLELTQVSALTADGTLEVEPAFVMLNGRVDLLPVAVARELGRALLAAADTLNAAEVTL